MLRFLSVLALATSCMASIPARAQTPAIDGPVYVAKYVEVVPSATARGSALLKQYRDASRNGAGNLRMELVQEVARPRRFALLEVWSDQKAFEAHGAAAPTAQLREGFRAIGAAPVDERVHGGMSVAAPGRSTAGALTVMTHVDVPGNMKDAVLPMLRDLSDASRKETGNLRFEVQQQGNRPNHFTMVELWADQEAYDAHVSAAHTRDFREKLGPMVGALYDERMYRFME